MAAFEIVRRFFRQHRPNIGFADTQVDRFAFDFVTDELNGKNLDSDGTVRLRHCRHFPSHSDAMFENSVSRVWLGVHWRFHGTSRNDVNSMLSATDLVCGVPLGRAIAKDLYLNGLAPSPVTAPAVAPPAAVMPAMAGVKSTPKKRAR